LITREMIVVNKTIPPKTIYWIKGFILSSPF